MSLPSPIYVVTDLCHAIPEGPLLGNVPWFRSKSFSLFPAFAAALLAIRFIFVCSGVYSDVLDSSSSGVLRFSGSFGIVSTFCSLHIQTLWEILAPRGDVRHKVPCWPLNGAPLCDRLPRQNKYGSRPTVTYFELGLSADPLGVTSAGQRPRR